MAAAYTRSPFSIREASFSIAVNRDADGVRRRLAWLAWLARPLDQAAQALGCRLRLAGGWVRDVIIASLALAELPVRTQAELDVVTEGDAPALGQWLKRRWGGSLTVHDAFRTATWRVPAQALAGTAAGPEPLLIDLITARSEIYPGPGQLPRIAPASFAADMARRDFSLNTFAADWDALMPLTQGASSLQCRGQANALQDLRAGLIRALHADSLQDDPTRAYRAVRYEQRFGFALEAATARLIQQALADGGLAALTAARTRHEMERIFQEAQAAAIVQRLSELGLLALFGVPDVPAELAAAVRRVPADDAARADVCWILLLSQATSAAGAFDGLGLGLAGKVRKGIGQFRRLGAGLEPAAWTALRPSQKCRGLRGLEEGAVRALRAWHPALEADLERYEKEWQAFRPALDGKALLALGYAPGPRLGAALNQLRDAGLDGAAPADAVAFIQRLLGPPAAPDGHYGRAQLASPKRRNRTG